MKVILIKDVPKLGRRFDTKEVSDGYALNLLIPRGLAVAGTPDAVKRLGAEKAKFEGGKKVQLDLLAKNLGELDGKELVVTEKANEKGHLFAGLHTEEIVKEIKTQTTLDIAPEMIDLEHPIKEVGEHIISIKGAGKTVKMKLTIKAK